MFKMKGTKRSLLMSALALLLCVSMLIGSTFAWFTDSVTSAGNIIKSGSLKISMKWADGKEAPATASWKNAADGAIFNYDKWEPGYTEARHIAVKNEGTLALKYQLTIVPTGEVSKLAEVIDVYYFKDGKQIKDRADLSAYTPVGTLDELINNEISVVDVMPSGKLAEDEGFVATLVLKMQESAGNEYQDLSIGTDFSVKLIATQLTKENDSYGPDYDEDAWVDGFKVFNANDLQTAIDNGETNISLQNDIVLDTPVVIPAAASTYSLRATPVYTVINLNGNSITTADPTTTYALNNLGNLIIVDTVGNGSINARGIYNGYGNGGENVTAANLIIENGIFNAMGTDGGAAIFNYGNVEIKSGTFTSNGGYGLNNRGVMIVENANVKGGIYNIGDLTVTNSTVYQHLSGRHAIYNWEGSVVVNGGNFDSISGNELILADGQDASVVLNGGTYNKTGKSWLFGAATGKNISFVINAGTFNGYVNLPENTVDTIRPYGDPITVYGGTFNFDPTNWVAEGFKAVETAAGYEVISTDRDYIVDGVLVSTDGKTYYISNATGYAWMDDQTDDFFLNKTVMIDADIDFGGAELNSIKFWNGKATVDGQGHTLSNFVITDNGGNAGLFQGTLKIQNLNVEKATVTGKYVGVLAGNMYGDIDNCSIKDCTINGTYWQTGALAGQYNAGNITNCVVEDCTINGLSAVGGLVGILNESTGVRKIENCSLINNKIVQTGSFGGDYDNFFGVAIGLINIENSTVYFNKCELDGNTLKGVASNALFGVVESGTEVYVDGVKLVADAASLSDALANGKDAVLTGDVKTESATTAPYGNKYAFKQDGGVLDGNGYELYMECYGDDYGIMTSGGTVKNIIIKEACRAIMIMCPTQDVILDNVQIGGDGVLYPINTGEAGADGVDLIVTNSTLAGWTSYSNIASASFTNVKFEQGTYYNNIYGRVLKPYVNTTMTDCSFVEHMNLDLSGLAEGQTVTMNNCTVNGTAVTMDVFSIPTDDAEYDTELFTVDLPSWATSVADCIVIG